MCAVGTHASQTTGSAQTELPVLSTEMEIPAQNVGLRVEELGSQGLFTPVRHMWPWLCSLPLFIFSAITYWFQISFQVYSGKMRSELVLIFKVKYEKTIKDYIFISFDWL